MSVKRDGFHGYIVYCDHCSADYAAPNREFSEAVGLAKLNGWRTSKDAQGQWENLCPECVGKRGTR